MQLHLFEQGPPALSLQEHPNDLNLQYVFLFMCIDLHSHRGNCKTTYKYNTVYDNETIYECKIYISSGKCLSDNTAKSRL